MKPIALLIALLSVAGSGSAGEPLGLSAAVERALADSPTVRAAEERASAAAARADQAAGFRLPSVDLTESYQGTNNPAEAFALQLNQERFSLMDFSTADPNHPDWLDTFVTRLEVTQPLYTGGKLAARVDQAALMATAAERDFAHAREQVGFSTITAFTNLAKAREYRQLLEKARATTAEHVRLAEQYAEQGLLLQAEVLKARVYLAEVDDLLVQATNGASLAEAALSFAMGADQSSSWELEPLPPMPPVGGELGDWVATALDRRRDLAAARRMLEAGRLEEKVARAPFLPELALVGRYDLYDDMPFGGHGASGAIMGVARINLFRGGADDSGLAAARHQTTAFASDLRRFEEGVKLEVQQAWHDLAAARDRQKTAGASLAAAREALAVREARFRQGLDKMIDLLDDETALRETEARELVARYDLALATCRLHFAAGASLVDVVLPTEEKP